MKHHLGMEELERRDCPAAGSDLVTLAVEPQFTLSLNTFGRFASMQLAAPEWAKWRDGQVTQTDVQLMTQRIYRYFPDQFDTIMFVNNVPDVSPASPSFGVNFPVKNTVTGIGENLFNNTAQFSSAGNLQDVIHIASEKALYPRTSLHEFLHLTANYLPQLQS